MLKKLLNKSWEWYREYIMAWQTQRGYPRFRQNYYIKADTPRGKW